MCVQLLTVLLVQLAPSIHKSMSATLHPLQPACRRCWIILVNQEYHAGSYKILMRRECFVAIRSRTVNYFPYCIVPSGRAIDQTPQLPAPNAPPTSRERTARDLSSRFCPSTCPPRNYLQITFPNLMIIRSHPLRYLPRIQIFPSPHRPMPIHPPSPQHPLPKDPF